MQATVTITKPAGGNIPQDLIDALKEIGVRVVSKYDRNAYNWTYALDQTCQSDQYLAEEVPYLIEDYLF